MGPIALFDTIHGSYFTILANFYLHLQYFQQKVFSFSKINGSQTDPKGFGILNQVSKNKFGDTNFCISVDVNFSKISA